jgi:hypothetical protein
MKKSEVPPNWTELVEKSSEQVTDKDYDLAKIWLFPDANSGDIAMQTNKKATTLPTDISNDVTIATGNKSITDFQFGHQVPHLDFSRSNYVQGISQEDSIPSFYSDLVNESLPQMQDNNSAPALINLETSGLQRLPRLAALRHNNDAPTIAAYTSSTTPSLLRLFSKPRPRLLFLSVFNLVGSLWTFATTSSHTDYETFSFVA